LENTRKIKDGKARGRAVEAAKKRIKREIENNSKEKYSEKTISKVKFYTDITHSKLMVSFEDVVKKYGDNTVFKNFPLILEAEKRYGSLDQMDQVNYYCKTHYRKRNFNKWKY